MKAELNAIRIRPDEYSGLDAIYEPAMLITSSGKVLKFNAAAASIFSGCTTASQGRSLFDLVQFASHSTGHPLASPFTELLDGRPYTASTDLRMICPEGHRFLVTGCHFAGKGDPATYLPANYTTCVADAATVAELRSEAKAIVVTFRLAPESQIVVDENEDLIRATAHMAKIGGWEVDCDSGLVKWTQETFRIHELPPERELPLEEAINFYHPDDQPILSRAIARAMNESVPYDLELRLITAKGNLKYTNAICQPVVVNGRVTKLRGTFQDVTDQVIARQEIALQRQRLDDALSGSSAGTWEWHIEARTIVWNERWAEMLGYTLDELSPGTIDTWNSLCHPDDLRETEEVARACFRKERHHYIVESRMRHKQGHWLWILERGYISRWGADDRPELMSGTSIDITERKKTEVALQESETRYRDLFDKSSAVKLVIDPADGRILEANAAACKFYGYSLNEFLTLTVFDINSEPKDVVQRRMQEVTTRKTREFDFPHRMANGEIRDVHVHSGPVSVNGKQLLHSIIVDVTEKKRAEEALQQMQRLESLGTLAGGIAHDFNNILTGIFGNVSLARLAIDVDQHAHRFLEAAEKSIHRASRLSTQLLTFARGGEPVKEMVDLKELLISVTCFDLTGSNVKPEFTFQAPIHEVCADRGQLQQVFSNLILNAAQSMPDGGVVVVSARNVVVSKHDFHRVPAGDYVLITIRDNGVGIPEELIKRVFEPYFTTKQTGHGLGLATTYSIVQKHRGHIEVASRPGSGTTFTILLPASAQPSEPCAAKSRSANGPEKLEGLRALIMDDEQPILDVMSAMLARMGLSVSTSRGVKSAIDACHAAVARNQPFDVAILDLTIPGGPGGKVAVQHIAQILPDIKIICTSGYAEDAVMADFANFGFVGALTKPYTYSQLQGAVQQAVDTCTASEQR